MADNNQDQPTATGAYQGAALELPSQHKQTMVASERQETNKYQMMFINASDAIELLDNQGFITDCNPSFAQLIGYDQEEIIGQHISRFFTATSKALFQIMFPQLQAKGCAEGEVQFLHKNGAIVYVWRKAQLFWDEQGIAQGVVVYNRDITQRKQTEENLHRERALLTSLLDSIPDLIFYKNVAGVYLGCNTAFAEFAGRSVADIVGKTDFDMFPHEIAAFFREQDAEMMAQAQARHNDEWVNYPDGRRVLLDTLKTPFYDTDKNLLGLIGISRNITAAYRSQEELLRLSYVVEQSLDGTAVADMDGLIQFANPAWAAMHGYTVEELIGQHLSIFHTPEQLNQEVAPLNEAVLATGQTVQAEVGHVRKNGSVFATLMTIGVLKDANSTAVGLVAAAQDITERKAAENNLRESQSRLLQANQVVENSPVILFRWRADEHWTVEYVSENVARFGYRPEDFLNGRVPYATIIHPDDLARVAQEVVDYSANGVAQFTQEYRIVTSDGEVRWTDDRTVIIRNDDGQITHYQGIVIDITERKAAESELQLRNSALEAAADCIVITDPKGTILYVNSAFTRLTQYTREEAVGNTLRLVKSGVHDEAFYQQMWDVLLSGHSWHGEIMNRRKDGVLYPEDMTITPVTTDTGEITYFIAIKRDITERKEGERARREGQTRLNEALRVARLYPWELDIDTLQFTFTPEYYELLGTSVAEEGGLTMRAEDYARKYVPAYESPVVEQETIAALNTTDPNYRREFDSVNVTKDGRIIPIRVRFSIVKNEAGRTIKTLGANQDITEQVKAEQALREAQTRAETILRAVTVPLLIANMQEGQIVYANEHLAAAVRLPLDKLIGNATPDFYVRNEDKTAVISQIQTHGDVQNYQLQLRREDGELFWALLSARLIEFQGSPAIITTFIDISDRIAAETKLMQQARDLQTVADVSTAVRANLQNQQELLQQVVDLTKERFDLYHAHIYLLDPAGKTLMLTAGAGEVGRKMVAEGRRIPLTQEQSLVARAARTRQGVSINNVQSDPGFLPNPLLPDTRAELAVPMLAGDQLIGVLDIQASQPGYFTDKDINIQTTLAAQIAIAVENSRLLNQSQQAITELDTLTRRLTRESWEGYLQGFGEQATGYIYDYGQLLPLGKADHHTLATASLTVENPDSGLQAPLTQSLTVHGEPVGRLALYHEDDDETISTLAADEMSAIIAAVAEQLSTRIENIRLTDQTQAALAETEEQARRLALLNEMGAALNTAIHSDDVYKIAGQYARNILGGDRASISLIDKDAHAFQMFALSGIEGPLAVGQLMPLPGTVVNEVLHRRQLLILPNNDLSLEDFFEGRQFAKIGFQSAIISPLLIGERIIGTLNVGSQNAHNFDAVSVNLMRQITTLLTTTLENQRLFNETQTRAEQLAAINQLAQAISQQLDRDQLLSTVNEQIRRIMPADSFIVALYDADSHQVIYPYINENGNVSQHPAMPLNPQSYIAQVIASRQPALHHLTPEAVADISLQDTALHLGDANQPSSASLMFAPLQIGARVTGAISVQSYAFNAYAPSDVTLLGGVANNVAVALENVRLFEETQQRAAQLQELSAIETALSQANIEKDILTALTLVFKENLPTIISLSYLDFHDETGEMMMDIKSLWMDGNFLPADMMAAFQKVSVEQYKLTSLWRATPNNFLFIEDIQEDPRADAGLQAQAAEQNWRATLVLPLQSSGQWQGLITFSWIHSRTLIPSEAFLMDRLMEPVAAVIATRRAQLAQQESLTETEALYTAGAELNSAQTFDDVLTVIRRHTVAGQNAQNVSLNYFDRPWTEQAPPDWVLVLARYSELPAGSVLNRYPLAAFPSAQTVLRSDAPTVFENVDTAVNLDEGSRTLYVQQFGAKSTVFVPLVVAGQWVGYINAIYQQTTHFTEGDLRRLMALSSQAAVAIQNIQLLQQTARKARREQLLREITAQVRSSADVDTIMKTAVQELGQALGRRAYIYVGHNDESEANDPKTKTGTAYLTNQYGA